MSFAEALTGLAKTVARHGRIERMLREIGWMVDEQQGKVIGLYFKCPVVGKRTLYILDDGGAVWFFTYSTAVFDGGELHSDPSQFALAHNNRLDVGKWEVGLNDNQVFFKLKYCAIGDGLSAAWLKAICAEMVEAATTFDRWMQKEGWL